MAAPETVEAFIALVRKSQLCPPEVLDRFLERRRASGRPPDERPSQLARALIRDGLLTQFQAKNLLAGKSRGYTINKYRILELLGKGGMGNVYLCHHTLMNRLVAFKALAITDDMSPSVVERFYREARAVASLHHPNIVHAYDVGQEGKLHFLIMEFVDGVNLYDLIARSRKPLDVHRVAHYLAQTAQGLEHAHQAGWVHRDIKPSNLLLDRQGVVKILDMGLARLFRDESDNLTKKFDNKSVIGTADFIAPEQALDSHNIDIRVDVYSLGATGYFLLTSRPPFPEGSPSQKLLAHQFKEPEPIRTLRPDVPAEFAAVIHRAMAKDRERRFQTPREFAEALAPWTKAPVPPPAPEELTQYCPLVERIARSKTPPPAP